MEDRQWKESLWSYENQLMREDNHKGLLDWAKQMSFNWEEKANK